MLLRKLALAAGVLAALAIPGAAWAGSDGWDHAPSVIPGSPCGHEGDKGTHAGERYECRLKHGQDCARWSYVYNPDTPKSTKTAWPLPSCPCESTTPTPTPTPSHTPTATPSGSAVVVTAPSPSTAPSKPAVSGSLPVTGSPVVGYAAVGIAAVLAGLLLTMAGRTFRRRTVREMS